MPGGTELHLLRLIRGLDRTCFIPHLCLLKGKGDPRSRKLEPLDCDVLRLDVKRLRTPSALLQLVQLVRYLRRNRIDIVEVLFPDSTYFGAVAARLAGVGTVVRACRNLGHDVTTTHRAATSLINRLIDAIVANCEAAQRRLVEDERFDPANSLVIPNGIDLEHYQAIPLKKTTQSSACIGMVGNLRWIKGPDLLLEAAAILAQRGLDFRVEIAGGGDHAGFHRLIEARNLATKVRLRGSIDQVPHFLADLDVAVLPSRSEGMSNALLEYMAAGRPIVATSVGGNVELVTHEVHGLLVPADNPVALAEAISRLLRDEALRMRLGAAARQRAVSEFSTRSMIEAYERLYQHLATHAFLRRHGRKSLDEFDAN